MSYTTVAVLTPGDMGHSVGNVLRHGGLRVITCLQGRSARTASLAAEAGIENVADYETLVREAEIILSILAPSAAGEVAMRVADAVRATSTHPVFVECNAIAPQTVRGLAAALASAGARFVDAGIIGGPPQPGSRGTRFYASGEYASEFSQLTSNRLEIIVLGNEIGQASGMKMCYGALTKGLAALGTELLVAAKAMGLDQALKAEFTRSQSNVLASLERTLPGMPPKAYRWVGEMEEIAATFQYVGLTPSIFEGAAAMYRFVEGTPMGAETPEARTRGATLDEVVAELALALPSAAAAPAD
jgi:3-hydroxyisobutyrate dehydrogenase-like beta-hydroxyacid dehydrogenase